MSVPSQDSDTKCLYQSRTVMCMCVREVSKCLYQARTVMCMCVREVSSVCTKPGQ